ncbi:hypothetical protein ACA910_022088 [Epithemia clementina (nom. ined.)]
MHIFNSGTSPDSPLFHSVDRRDARGPVKFRFHPDDSAEAHATIASLLPMLRHYFRCTYNFEENGIAKLSADETNALVPLLYRFFTPRAVTCLYKIKWDPIAGTCISQNNIQMTGVHQADTRFHFSACKVDMSGIEEPTDNTPAIVRTADQDANVMPPPAQYK